MTQPVKTEIIEPKTVQAQSPAAMSKNALTPTNLTEALQLSDMLAQSDIVPKEYKGKPGNVLVAIQWGMEIGLPPLQALQNLAVINGRPALWGDAALALVRGSGLLEYILEDDDGETATCRVKRKGEPVEHVRTFGMEDAKQAGLLNKPGPWMQYPKRMRQMRARAFALRDVFPDVLKGVAVAEEAQDIPTEEPKDVIKQSRPAKSKQPEIPRHKELGNAILQHCGNDPKAMRAFVIETLEWPGDTELKGKWFDKLTDEELDILESALKKSA